MLVSFTLPQIFFMIRLIIFIGILILLEVYAFQAIRTAFRSKWVAIGFEVVSLLIIAFVIYSIVSFDRSVGQNRLWLTGAALMFLMLLPKIVIGLTLLIEDIIRGFVAIYNAVSTQSVSISHLPQRRRFVSTLALGIAAVPFLGLLHGIFFGRYNFRVIRQQLFFDDLPDAFDGFTITQISDIHSGSFDNGEKIEYAIGLINEQDSDVVLFTGDIVNARAEEMYPWIDVFKKINPGRFGKFSILGNHDYGEYLHWKSQSDKIKNFEEIKALHQKIGFRLMLNEHQYLERDGQRIALVGVENWGVRFKQAGDLAKASRGLKREDFKILMTHDPSHWEYEVKDHPDFYHLTFAGHTHGFQFGIEIPGFVKWSPAQYVYKQWAGLYENLGRYVYVNRGFGYHAYPGRVGIWPEITVIELKKRGNVS